MFFKFRFGQNFTNFSISINLTTLSRNIFDLNMVNITMSLKLSFQQINKHFEKDIQTGRNIKIIYLSICIYISFIQMHLLHIYIIRQTLNIHYNEGILYRAEKDHISSFYQHIYTCRK